MKTQKSLTVETLTKDIPFEDVLPLIKPMISRIVYSINDIYGLEKEDLEQELTLRAYMSWQTWAPDGGTKFSTYVYNMLTKHKNYLVRSAKTQRRNCGLPPFSLDGPNDGDGGKNDSEPYYIQDFCADNTGMDLDDHVYMLEVCSIVEKVFLSQSSRAQDVIRRVLDGETQEIVSRETGITQSQVSYYMKIFRTKVREELERRDFDLPFTTSTKSCKKARAKKPDLSFADT